MHNKPAEQHCPGILIEPPRLLTKAFSAAADFAFHAAVALLCLSGAAWSVISAFSIPVYPFAIQLFLCFMTTLFLVSARLERAGYLILAAVALSYFGFLLYIRDTLAEGFFLTANQIFSVWSAQSGFRFPSYAVSADAGQYAPLCTVFLLTVFLPVTGLVCHAVYKKSVFLAALWTAPFLLAALTFHVTFSIPAAFALGTGLAVLIFLGPVNRKRKFSQKRPKLQAEGIVSQMGLGMLPVVAACFALLYLFVPAKQYQPPAQAETVRNEIMSRLADVDALFQMGSVVNGFSGQVNLKHVGSIHLYGKTMLRVWTSDAKPVYLKGFTGSVYDNSGWRPLPDAQYKEIESKLGDRNVQNMLESYLGLFSAKNGTVSQFELKVRNVAASRRWIYAPYALATTPQNITGVRFVHDASICSSYLAGTAKYNLFAYRQTDQNFRFTPENVFLSLLADMPFSNHVSSFALEDRLRPYLQRQSQFRMLSQNNIQDYYKSTLSKNDLDLLSGEKRNFIEAEQEYRLFLYKPYTTLPQGLRKQVRSLLKKEGLLTDYPSVDEMVSAVQKFLSREYAYTLSPGSVPEGWDFTSYFLFQNKKGYCVHFATAATVMLRAMGIPARYAEGYIVTSDDYKNASDGWANVKDDHAHAWVEIYNPGYGWKPVEVTSGFENLESGNQNLSAAWESSQTPSIPSPQETENKLPVSASPAASQAPAFGISGARAVLFFVCLPFLMCLFLMLFLLLRRKFILIQREKRFSISDSNAALLSIYTYCFRMEPYGAQMDQTVTELAEKARFSRHRISKEQVNICRDYAKNLAVQTYENLTLWKKMRFKYWDQLI